MHFSDEGYIHMSCIVVIVSQVYLLESAKVCITVMLDLCIKMFLNVSRYFEGVFCVYLLYMKCLSQRQILYCIVFCVPRTGCILISKILNLLF